MNALLSMLDRIDELAAPLMGMELADDRGNLSPDQQRELAALQHEQVQLIERARDLWEALPATAPAIVTAHDRSVGETIARLRAGGGRVAGVNLADLEPRALRTCLPTRCFDAWAIRAVYRTD